MIAHELRQMCSPDDGSAVRDGGKRGKAELHRLMNAEDDSEQDVHVRSFVGRSSQRSHRSCVHIEVPLMFSSSILFLDKPLFISFIELKARTIEEPVLFRSTLSVRLGVSSKNQPSRRDEGQVASQGQQPGAARCSERCLLVMLRAGLMIQIHGAMATLWDCHHSGGQSPQTQKTGEQKENADEFRREPLTPNLDPESLMWRKQAAREKAEDQHDFTREQEAAILEHTCLGQVAPRGNTTFEALSLKEALELFRPDFISRSQGRVRKMEQRAMKRRALRGAEPDSLRHLETTCKQRRNYTTPDPLSDNLFKPRERSITGREMQLRSRRIYNKLPEVTKKKEEEKKRAVSQTNRLRVEAFKRDYWTRFCKEAKH